MVDRQRTIPQAVRELLLAFPQAEEFESHGSPNFRARKGKVFAVFALNHHGDGHVALWLNTPYVGPSGWIGVELNRGLSWKRVIELAQMAYANSSPAKLVATITKAPAVAAPTMKMKPEEIDRLKSAKALKLRALMRKICLALPETDDDAQSFGSPVWRVGKKTFASLYDYGKGLTVSFWVGIERQGPLEMDPRLSIPAYSGHNGWMALEVSKGVSERELREFIVESYRHFAPRRALAKLDA
jgi:predicted DNA-binding protein (MmcQ/YjbR family)